MWQCSEPEAEATGNLKFVLIYQMLLIHRALKNTFTEINKTNAQRYLIQHTSCCNTGDWNFPGFNNVGPIQTPKFMEDILFSEAC